MNDRFQHILGSLKRRVVHHHLVSVVLVGLLCLMSFFMPCRVCEAQNEPISVHHNDGKRYCIQARDVVLTTRQVAAFQRSDTLQKEILLRAQPLIRILPDMQIYDKPFQTCDLSTLGRAANTQGREIFHVLLQVDSADASLGEIVIAVEVIETPPAIVESSIPQSLMYVLFRAPGMARPQPGFSSADLGVSVNIPAANRLPTEVTPHGVDERRSIGATDTTTASSGMPGGGKNDDSSGNRSVLTSTKSPFSRIDWRTVEKWAALIVYGVTVLGALPFFILSIAKDIRVLSWYHRHRVELKDHTNDAFS